MKRRTAFSNLQSLCLSLGVSSSFSFEQQPFPIAAVRRVFRQCCSLCDTVQRSVGNMDWIRQQYATDFVVNTRGNDRVWLYDIGVAGKHKIVLHKYWPHVGRFCQQEPFGNHDDWTNVAQFWMQCVIPFAFQCVVLFVFMCIWKQFARRWMANKLPWRKLFKPRFSDRSKPHAMIQTSGWTKARSTTIQARLAYNGRQCTCASVQ